jgi:hypothetical protein
MTPDHINALFEVGGCIAILNHCRVAYRDKAVNGVSILSTIFFTSWGFWNMYYYPSLDQWASFLGGVAISMANMLWVFLLVKYHYIAQKKIRWQA